MVQSVRHYNRHPRAKGRRRQNPLSGSFIFHFNILLGTDVHVIGIRIAQSRIDNFIPRSSDVENSFKEIAEKVGFRTPSGVGLIHPTTPSGGARHV